LFVWLISHQPTVFFSHNKPATSNQSAVFFSHNKPATSNQPTVLFSQNKSAPTNTSQTNNPDERKGRAEETEETRDSSSP
jgi:hypothetical protein